MTEDTSVLFTSLSEKLVFTEKTVSQNLSAMRRGRGYLREEPQVLRVAVRLRRVCEAVCVHQGVITCTTPHHGIHTLWMLRDVGNRYVLVEVAIGCKVARYRHIHDTADSPTGSPIVTHVPVNQSVKSRG
jgi:hypothetical protein